MIQYSNHPLTRRKSRSSLDLRVHVRTLSHPEHLYYYRSVETKEYAVVGGYVAVVSILDIAAPVRICKRKMKVFHGQLRSPTQIYQKSTKEVHDVQLFILIFRRRLSR